MSKERCSFCPNVVSTTSDPNDYEGWFVSLADVEEGQTARQIGMSTSKQRPKTLELGSWYEIASEALDAPQGTLVKLVSIKPLDGEGRVEAIFRFFSKGTGPKGMDEPQWLTLRGDLDPILNCHLHETE
jgi:hypothetical protein